MWSLIDIIQWKKNQKDSHDFSCWKVTVKALFLTFFDFFCIPTSGIPPSSWKVTNHVQCNIFLAIFFSFLVTSQPTAAVTSVITRAFHQNGKILIRIKNACIIRMLGGLKVIINKSHGELSLFLATNNSWMSSIYILGYFHLYGWD